ncbi:hypothetical protein R3P38DRAFT_2799430 [Favolaschia claudopus]|uniref:Uncharacterized protein n=1 Tax=Favolaschia claudopus TaxID=2862362 RepID=A0AAV9ZZM6_9AGAR
MTYFAQPYAFPASTTTLPVYGTAPSLAPHPNGAPMVVQGPPFVPQPSSVLPPVVIYLVQPPAPYAFAPAAPPPAKKEKEVKDAAPSAPAKDSQSTLPPALLAKLSKDGPYLANQVFSCPPQQPLEVIPEDSPAPEWYAIFKGRYVGVVDEYALCEFAISGVGQSARKAYSNQNDAVAAFNKALTWGGVQVV